MMLAQTCLGFHVECGNLVKGGLGVAVGFVLFIGSVLLMLSAVFGRKMGYLVLSVSLFGWMILSSAYGPSGSSRRARRPPWTSGPGGASRGGSWRRPART